MRRPMRLIRYESNEALINIIIASLLWSTIGLASVYSGSPLLLPLIRSTTAAIVAAFIYRSLNKAAITAGISLGVLFSVYPLAAVTDGVGLAAYLLYTAPLWATLVSLILGERPGKYSVIGLIIIAVAVIIALIDAGLGGINYYGAILGLVSGISYGLYIAIARFFSKLGMSNDVSYGALPFTLIMTAPLLPFLALIHRLPPLIDLGKTLVAGAYMGIFCTVIPYKLFAMGVARVRAALASILATLEPVMAAVWGYLFLRQIPNSYEILIYLLITIALITSSIDAR
jgi:drug/metabolite transporter (DMT)-like permease